MPPATIAPLDQPTDLLAPSCASPRWCADLNPDQIRAVQHRGGPLLVVAGAGTGKTRTLAARVASLVAEGVRPERILLLTFTRRAAAEMIGRARAASGDDTTRHVHGGTFHAVGHQILRREARTVGLHDGFTILDEGDAVDLLGLVRAEVVANLTGGQRFPRAATLGSILSRVANAQEPLSEVLRRQFPWCADHADQIREVFGGYAARKRADNAVDFDDLLLYWRALLADPAAGARIRQRYDHVLVDEYQDVNSVQADIVQALARGPEGPGACVTAVGDDAQAIYGFRAASPDHLLDFPDHHPGTTVVTLDRTYRCTTPILAVANAIHAEAKRAHDKRLWSPRPGGVRPVLLTTRDEHDQSRAVCDAVLDARERGMDLRDQAVLYRTGTHANDLELELARRDIPFVKFGGLKFLERAHVKDLHALLRVLDNPADRLAWHRVLRLGEGIGPAWERRLLAAIGAADWSPDRDASTSPVARFLDAPVAAPAQAQEFLGALRAAWSVCIGEEDTQPDPGTQIGALRAVCEITWPMKYPDAAARLGDLDRLAVAASAHPTRGAFLADLTLDPPNATGDLAGEPHLDDDWLTLSTIHSAKGLEWRAVHLIHAADGNLPSDMALRDEDGLEEERRLAYVAVTRARDELRITVPLRYHVADSGLADRHLLAPVSRFLQPIRDLFDEGATGEAARPEPEVADGPTVVESALADLWAS